MKFLEILIRKKKKTKQIKKTTARNPRKENP